MNMMLLKIKDNKFYYKNHICELRLISLDFEHVNQHKNMIISYCKAPPFIIKLKYNSRTRPIMICLSKDIEIGNNNIVLYGDCIKNAIIQITPNAINIIKSKEYEVDLRKTDIIWEEFIN